MHELSLCNSIFKVVERASPDRTVTQVNLEVGKLRQVIPDTLRYCWGLVTAETVLADSELVIDSIPVRLTCNQCRAATEVGDVPILVCGGCGGGDVTVTTGEEFMITSVQLQEA